MLYYTTDNPTAKTEGDRIVVTFPSGKDKAQFPLTLDQALYLYQIVRRQAHAAFKRGGFAHCDAEPASTAQIVAVPERLPSLVNRELRVRKILSAAAIVANAN